MDFSTYFKCPKQHEIQHNQRNARAEVDEYDTEAEIGWIVVVGIEVRMKCWRSILGATRHECRVVVVGHRRGHRRAALGVIVGGVDETAQLHGERRQEGGDDRSLHFLHGDDRFRQGWMTDIDVAGILKLNSLD